jgi:hypothetical protein
VLLTFWFLAEWNAIAEVEDATLRGEIPSTHFFEGVVAVIVILGHRQGGGFDIDALCYRYGWKSVCGVASPLDGGTHLSPLVGKDPSHVLKA